MNILFIANHLNVGGISSYLLTLGSGLKEKGDNVYLASCGGELEERFIRAGIILFKVPLRTKSEISPKIVISFLKLKKIAAKLDIDLIHSHTRTTQVLGCCLSRALGCAHIFTCHGFFKPRFFRRLVACWGQMVIAISQQVREHLINDFKLDKNMIEVIHNGIDIKRFGSSSGRDSLRARFGGQDTLLVGIIARLSDVKGHTFLIRAMPGVIKKFPQVKLLIIGQGKTGKSLVQEVRELSLENNVIFIPEINDTRDYLAALDIFVMPSLQEGLGLALMEAMAQGVAVVGSSVGGIKTLVQDKVNGLLVEPASVPSLQEAIVLLLADAGLRQSLGERARQFICANFSQEAMTDKTESVYRQVLEGKR
jgi:L-malate glycosyltransferase